jgi:hypothetical protein
VINVSGHDIHVKGGLLRIAHREADGYESLDNPEYLISGMRKCGTRIDLFTFIQIREENPPRYTYPLEMDNLAVLPIPSFDAWWKSLRSVTRNRARQAEKKGVVLREVPFDEPLVRGIWEIYNECPLRQGRKFPHYGKDIPFVRQHAGSFPDSSIFVGAFLEEKLIGFVKMTCDQTRTQANLMNILSMVKHRDKAASNALIAHAVRICAERGITHLVYQNFSYGKRQRDSLSDFKEHNGFVRVDVPRYYVPLTPLGWIAFRLGFHQRVADRIPGPLMEKFRELRAAWYNRKTELTPQVDAK